jgi:hypothetical protein
MPAARIRVLLLLTAAMLLVAAPRHGDQTWFAAFAVSLFSGPAHCWVIGILQTFGKNQGGKLATKGCLRHKDPLLDVQSALGRYFVTRFTLGGEAFPDPCSKEFLTVKIWPGRKDFSSSLSYGGHRARFAKVYKALDIKIKKVTHAPRYHTVRKADEAGLAEEVGNGWDVRCGQREAQGDGEVNSLHNIGCGTCR